VFTAPYELSPYIKQARFVIKGLNASRLVFNINENIPDTQSWWNDVKCVTVFLSERVHAITLCVSRKVPKQTSSDWFLMTFARPRSRAAYRIGSCVLAAVFRKKPVSHIVSDRWSICWHVPYHTIRLHRAPKHNKPIFGSQLWYFSLFFYVISWARLFFCIYYVSVYCGSILLSVEDLTLLLRNIWGKENGTWKVSFEYSSCSGPKQRSLYWVLGGIIC
jgi:hypothetical protein